MFLRKLTLLNFKNHQQRDFVFRTRLVPIIGLNGIGKTNLLDAVYYVCLTKSYFSSSDQQNILQGSDFFRLEASCDTEAGTHRIVYKLPGGKKKELEVNDIPVARMTDHIGNFPAVMIAPDDNQLVLGGSEERRKFLDSTISQVNPQYLGWLIAYNKVLAQRNAALKDFAERNRTDKALLETYNRSLTDLGTKIYQVRQVVAEKLQPVFRELYRALSLERDQVRFQYVSQLHDKPLEELLQDGLRKDLALQRTEWGIHKDDLDFFIAENKIKKFGSQGQQKSFIIALKLAEYRFIAEAKGFLPFLLIDDIFDKLDADRSRQLIHLITSDRFGQVFVTDTEEQKIKDALSGKEDLYEIIKI